MHTRASTRVLVVEDEPTDVSRVQRSLRPGEGGGRFEVRHASTLAEGFEQLGRDPVDVLLLDLGLPDSDGVDTVVRFRLRAPHLPLVVFTGSDDPKLAARTLEAGADGHVVKGDPGAHDLRRTLHQAIERRVSLRRAAPRDTPAGRDAAEEELTLLHDLRNLHAVVLGNAEILRDDAEDHPQLRARADALVRAARVAAVLTERLFAQADRSGLPEQSVELSELVRRAVPLLRSVIPERIELRLHLLEGLAPVSKGVERLFCALLELVANAVEAIGDSDGVLELRTGASVIEAGGMPGLVARDGFEGGPHVWIEVRDTGGGFDAASLLRPLEPGFGAGGAGSGYGSSHLEELLAEDEAALFVDSRPGEGATFRILLRSQES